MCVGMNLASLSASASCTGQTRERHGLCNPEQDMERTQGVNASVHRQEKHCGEGLLFPKTLPLLGEGAEPIQPEEVGSKERTESSGL